MLVFLVFFSSRSVQKCNGDGKAINRPNGPRWAHVNESPLGLMAEIGHKKLKSHFFDNIGPKLCLSHYGTPRGNLMQSLTKRV